MTNRSYFDMTTNNSRILFFKRYPLGRDAYFRSKSLRATLITEIIRKLDNFSLDKLREFKLITSNVKLGLDFEYKMSTSFFRVFYYIESKLRKDFPCLYLRQPELLLNKRRKHEIVLVEIRELANIDRYIRYINYLLSKHNIEFSLVKRAGFIDSSMNRILSITGYRGSPTDTGNLGPYISLHFIPHLMKVYTTLLRASIQYA